MGYDCTAAEEALLTTLEGLLDASGHLTTPAFTGQRILVVGNRSGLLPCVLAKAGAAVDAHMFDCHHARAVRARLAEAHLDALAAVHCTPQVPPGPYARAYFMTTPLSMTGELVLDQLEDIRAVLAPGGELFAAFEGQPEESLKTMKKVFARVHVLQAPDQSRRGRRRGVVALFRAVKGPRDAEAPRRNFAAEWTASVPGGETRTFTSLPGCFCHRRADLGGLALAEAACALAVPDNGTLDILDMGCGCGFVGLLVADHARRRGANVRLTLLDSHARALAAARTNATRLGFDGATFILADDGPPPDTSARYGLFLGNPPYYGDWRIAETFITSAFRALAPGGRCLTVAKSEGGLKEIQARTFGETTVIRRRGYCVFSSIHP